MNLKIAFALLVVPPAATVWADMFPKPYKNSFEKSSDVSDPLDAFFVVTRVQGTSTMKASSGKYYATAPVDGGSFVRYGGYSGEWPRDGYTTSIDIYLDKAQNNFDPDTQLFEYSSAIEKQCTPAQIAADKMNETYLCFLRDFIFHVFSDGLGNFIIGGNNNASPGYVPTDFPERFTISSTGWYTFRHYFHAKGDGTLEVVMSVLDAKGNVRGSSIRNDSSDLIATVVGGNRYGWFVSNAIDKLKIDNVTRSGGVIVKNKTECINNGWKTVFKKDYGRFLSEKACTDYVKKGKLRL